MPEIRTIYGVEDFTALIVVCNGNAIHREGKCGHENRYALGDAAGAFREQCHACGNRLIDNRPTNSEANLTWGLLNGLQGLANGELPLTIKLEVVSEKPHIAIP